MKKIPLVLRLLIGIISGIIIGLFFPEGISRILYTFTIIFGEFLNYIVPLVILAFIIPGIADLGEKAGRLLGTTVLTAYVSTITAGTIAYLISVRIVPAIVEASEIADPEAGGLEPFLRLEISPVIGVMSALVTAFVFGLGINYLLRNNGEKSLYNIANEFRDIIVLVIEYVIIPFLPLHIAGVFADMAFSGNAFETLAVFSQVFAIILIMHIGYLLIQFFFAGSIAGKNPLKSLKNMIPAYTTAIGTMSSAATIPVTLKSARKNNITEEIVDFVIPLGATVHLAGSTISLVVCAVAVAAIMGLPLDFALFFQFIALLGVTMVAAPGVPGGAVMAALGLLTSILGFGEGATALMIGLYLAQDSFGTACNVTGDGAIAIFIDAIKSKLPAPKTV
ncbi:dicarboxylate/amino acid:cation symporter [Halanaerobium sp. Z-7514]|uniref:Dicarboxylate/amino acid:cation symporter n=1 Tax=Halanaerobium polyolivorans TaxID=2886943 RepID=A0AAW4WSN2_9FIRM|nr:dicarboxylate/amino acid:cation symporter [Halanaerobium polyolivorans]MCC3144117.1 dicarboxylate/amino acid:cation symporter [Halanaerobium polyolivorans]RQD75218.1 MAG: dicarboxylate/amino acid:cation symporter [Halanaerobium sp. MSAO_Bac5]